MNVLHEQQGPATVIIIQGSVDALTAPQLNNFLGSRLQDGQTRLVIDLGGMDYVSSAGLRVLLGAAKEARQQGGDVRLAAAQAGVQRVLEMSGFTSILKNFDGVSAAVASYTRA